MICSICWQHLIWRRSKTKCVPFPANLHTVFWFSKAFDRIRFWQWKVYCSYGTSSSLINWSFLHTLCLDHIKLTVSLSFRKVIKQAVLIERIIPMFIKTGDLVCIWFVARRSLQWMCSGAHPSLALHPKHTPQWEQSITVALTINVNSISFNSGKLAILGHFCPKRSIATSCQIEWQGSRR